MKSYNKKSDEGHFLQVDVQYLQKLHELHNDLLISPERMKIGKVEKLVANLHDITEYVIPMRNLNQGINHGLVSKKVFKKNYENDFKKYFFKLMSNAVLRKTMDNLRQHGDLKLVKTERRRNYLVSEPNYHTTKFYTEYLLAIKLKPQSLMK